MKESLDYRSIFYYSKLPSYIYDLKNFQILEVNQSAIDLYGFSKEEFLLLTLKKLSPKEETSTLRDVHRVIDKTKGNVYFGIFTHQKKNGEHMRVEIHGHKLKFDGRNCVLVTCQDKIQNEKQLSLLKEKSKQLEAISSVGKIGYWRLDLDDNTLLWTEEVYKIWGRNKEDFEVNFNIFEKTIHPKDLEAYTTAKEAVFAGEKILDFEHRIILPDQSFKWVRENGRLLKNKEGKPYAFEGTVQDITREKKEEFRLLEITEKFKESEFRLRDLSDNLPGAVFQYVLFPDGTDTLRSVSKGSYQLWGYSPKDVEQDINLVWDQIKAGGEYKRVKKEILEAIKTKSKWQSRYKSILPNGDVRISLGSGSPNFLADGTVLFNSVVLDITDEARNEKLLSDATQMARIGSWEVNFVNNKILWSDIMHQLHETNPKSFIPELEKSIEFYREDFRDMVRSRVQACLKDGKPFDFEAVLVTAKNNERWVRVIGRAEMINGECMRIHGSFQDIDDYKTIELELAQSVRMLQDYQHVVDQSASLTITDTEGVIIDVNDKFCKLSQYSREELIGSTHRVINSKYHSNEFFASLWSTINSGKIWRGEVRNRKKDSSYYWADTTIVPFCDKNNTPFKFLVLRKDITEKKIAEEQVKELNKAMESYTKELERSNEELEQFAYISSHDLQEPLRMITSFMDQLKRKYQDELDEKALQYIHFATDGAKRMKQIILDLLLYSRANKFSEQIEMVNLNEIISEYTQLRRTLIAEKKASIKFENLPTLKTYKAPITQIFHCLIDNAMKYVKENGTPHIEILGQEKEEEWVFAIKDNGIGIDEKFFNKIFIIFQRLHNRSENDGTGIGLSIAKRSVESLGGDIWVESKVGEGSTFYFTIAKI